jgi:hypothetical protein
MRSAITAIVCLAALACASTAQAEQRYAAPAGTGSACSQAAPCSLKESLVAAESNDEVIVTTGSYVLSSAITVPGGVSNLYVHGDFAAAMPRIAASVTSPVIESPENGYRIAYLEITNTSTEGGVLVCRTGWQIERVRFAVTTPGGIALAQNENCLVRDSLLLSIGTGSAALTSGGSALDGVVRNVTAIATGANSVGISAFSSGNHGIDLKNVIAGGDGFDLKAQKGPFGAGKIFVSNSNFDSTKTDVGATIVGLGGNQTAAPLFVDAANGDYREAAGSPTIDAGVADQLGPLDLAGNARILGAAPDIGAFEFVPPPPAAPAAAGQIQSLSLKPAKFRAGKIAGAISSRKKKAEAPLGTTVSYALSAAATTSFTLERLTQGREAGKKCVRQTRQNKGHAKCSLVKPVSGSFTNSGATGTNTFKFSGRIGGRALAPGSYRLVASAGGSTRSVGFKIVR